MRLPGRTPARQQLDAAMSEADLQTWILELAGLCGWRSYHTHDSRRSAAGFPDLVLVRRGRLIFAELKRQGQNPTADQQAWLDALEGVPAVDVHVWRPADRADIERVLR